MPGVEKRLQLRVITSMVMFFVVLGGQGGTPEVGGQGGTTPEVLLNSGGGAGTLPLVSPQP